LAVVGMAGLVASALAACAGGAVTGTGGAGGSTTGSGGSSSGGPDASPDAADDGGDLFDGGTLSDAAADTKFFILVTETPAGSPALSDWGGIDRYDVDADNGPAVLGPAIDKALVHDPLGLAFRKKSAEMFVGNRHGNNAADGVPGSISRFLYTAATESFTPNPLGEITGNGMGAISQIVFDPTEGELFAANCCNGGNGITRFLLDATGKAVPNGSIPGTDLMQGLAIAPDGKRLYATQGGGLPANFIRQFALPSGAELAMVPVPGSSRLHHMTLRGADLYLGDVDVGVFHLKLDGNDDLSLVETIPADNPLSVALNPDGLEMFATGHQFGTTSVIDRFQLAGGAWAPTSKVMTPTSNGGTLVFAAAAVPQIN
jgi:DNA-binding beta-propeller fold protein YncE